MEILAQKKRGLAAAYILNPIIGAFLIIIAVVNFIVGLRFSDTPVASIIVFGVLFIVMGIAIIVITAVSLMRVKKSPDCITLNGNQVDLGNGYIVNINQITDVDYREARARYSTLSWGTLTVYVENQKLNYYYIENVRHARDRIMQFILQSKLGI